MTTSSSPGTPASPAPRSRRSRPARGPLSRLHAVLEGLDGGRPPRRRDEATEAADTHGDRGGEAALGGAARDHRRRKRIAGAAGPGEVACRKLMREAAENAARYAKVRDLPGLDETTRLSPPPLAPSPPASSRRCSPSSARRALLRCVGRSAGATPGSTSSVTSPPTGRRSTTSASAACAGTTTAPAERLETRRDRRPLRDAGMRQLPPRAGCTTGCGWPSPPT